MKAGWPVRRLAVLSTFPIAYSSEGRPTSRRSANGHGHAMQVSFDPYYQWLGIPPAEQPANHYQLLGLTPFEADPATIDSAAAACITRVRTLSQGRHPELVEQLVREIYLARDTLEEPDLKTQYDRRLRELAGGTASVRVPAAVPIPVVPRSSPPSVVVIPAVTQPMGVGAGPASPVVAERIRRAADRKRSSAALALWCVGGGLAVLLVAGLLFLPWQEFWFRDQPSEPRPEQASVVKQSRTRRSSPRPSPRRMAQAASRAQEQWRPLPSQRPLGPPTLADLLEQADRAPSSGAKEGASTPEASAPLPSDVPPSASTDSTAMEPAVEPPRTKVPVPGAELLAKASGLVRGHLQENYLLADNAEKRIALAQQLLAMGEEIAGEPVVRYACFSLALEQAARVGDPQLIDQVVDRLAQDYDVDALYLRAETMATAWRSDYSVPHRTDLFKQSHALLTTALGAENYAAAGQAIRVVMAGARAAKDYRLLRELEEQREKIRAAEKTVGH